MNGSFCAVILQYAFSNLDLKELRTTFIVNCVFKNFLSYTVVILNIVTMYAIRRTSSLPKTLKTLLLSLAFSDVGVGLFVQSLHTFFLVKWLKLDHQSCNTYQVWNISRNLFSAASFPGVVAVSFLSFIFISVIRSLRLTNVLSLWWSLYGCSVHLFLYWYCGFPPQLRILFF